MKNLFALMLVCSFAEAGIKITAEIQQDSKQKMPLHFYLEKTKVRLDTPSPMDSTQAYRVIYDSANDNLAYLDDKRKTVLQMPVSQLEMLASIAAKIQTTKQPQGVGVSSPAVFKKTGKVKKVGKWTCKIHEFTQGAAKGELCASELKEVGLTKADLAPLQRLSKSLRPLLKTVPGSTDYPDYLWEKIDEMGLTIEAKGTAGKDKIPSSFEITKVEKISLPGDTFKVPAGYQPQGFSIGK